MESTLGELARKGKTAVAYGNEARIAKVVMDTVAVPTVSADEAAFVAGVIESVQDLHTMGMKVAVVMSQKTYNTVRKMTALNLDGITFNLSAGSPVVDGFGIQRAKMAIAFGVEDILVGQNKAWNDGVTNKDTVAIVALPDANLDPDAEPQFGRTFVLEQEATDKLTPFMVEYVEDPVSRSVLVDAVSFTEAKVMNDTLVQAVALPSTASVSAE